jgi:hypothetical protein
MNTGLPEAIAIALAITAPTMTEFFDLPTTPPMIGGIAWPAATTKTNRLIKPSNYDNTLERLTLNLTATLN